MNQGTCTKKLCRFTIPDRRDFQYNWVLDRLNDKPRENTEQHSKETDRAYLFINENIV